MALYADPGLARYLLQDTRVTTMKRLSVICGLLVLAAGLSGCAYDPAAYGSYDYGPRYSYVAAPSYGYGSYGYGYGGYAYGPSVSAVYVSPTYVYRPRPAPVRIDAGFGYRGWGGDHDGGRHGGWGGQRGGGAGWGGGHFRGHGH